jgi:reprolysin-like metallo-peptidase family M12B/Calx-beta domain-containing protein
MEDPVGLKVSRRLCVVAAMVASLGAANASAAVWRSVSAASVGAPAPERVLVGRHQVVEMDLAGMRALLGAAPLERTAAARQGGVVVELPWPDGGTRRFAMEKSPVVEPGLAALHPEIETYRGRGLDDASAMGRFDLGPSGFHGMVLSNQGTVYIDPWSRSDTAHYVSFFKRDYRRSEATGFHCDFDAGDPEMVDPSVLNEPVVEPQGATLHGDFLKTFRLALAANVEYSTFHGGTIPLVHNALVVAVNRVNTVYERDLAVHLNIIANNDLLIWLVEPDPYTNNNGGAMLTQNQASIDSIIGSANYDVGHVFSTGGGGVAGLGVVCGGNKARGVTGLPNPVGDPFYIDYVAHEMGHQFRGNHSFNGTTSNCGGGNRNAGTAWEPGSGSTVMAYAGICGAENLQPNSDDLFHVGNLINEMQPFVTTGAGSTCAASTSTGNPAPTVNGGADITIPANTPFMLTASATDPNSPTLSYVWEEMDLGTAAPPNTDDGSRPIFRTFNVLSSPSRTFPKLADILAGLGTPAFGEAWPTTNRTMNFRVTVRDNFAGGGATTTDLVQVTVVAAAGPFNITAPNTTVSWTGGSTQAVTWNVANTTAPPINAANVSITLSTDGGLTFPTVLAASTPNDGAENIVVPNLPTATARVRVQAVGNGFFDINNANLTILAGTGPGASVGDVSVTEGDSGTTPALFPVTLTAVSGVPVTVDYTTAPGTATAPGDYAITAGTLTFAPGETTRNVTVAVVGETAVEPDETFFLNISNLSGGGTIGDAQGQATIVNDDFGPVVINAGDASVVEGDPSTNPDLLVPVTLSGPSGSTVTVAFTTADDTATAGTDYVATSGTLTFAPGVTSQNVTVSVISDLVDEADETFFVNLSAPVGGTIGDGQGVGTITDDDGVTDAGSELAHGTRQVRTFDGPDTFAIAQRAYSSYEVLVDEASGDVVPVGLERIAADGTTVLQPSVAVGTGQARSLRWENSTSSDVLDQSVRVTSGDCTTNCGPDDTYRVRAWETTLAIPRFNNSGTQVTVLLLQNPTDGPITGNIYFWDATGAQVGTQPFSLAAKNLLVLNTATVAGANGVSGSLSVSHDGRYGELAAKSVALEPATGFSFDSPGIVRAR